MKYIQNDFSLYDVTASKTFKIQNYRLLLHCSVGLIIKKKGMKVTQIKLPLTHIL